jgi:hypothetical protein
MKSLALIVDIQLMIAFKPHFPFCPPSRKVLVGKSSLSKLQPA